MIFNWEFYVNKYKDLRNTIYTEEDAIIHFNNYGKNEYRLYVDIPILFSWEEYVNYNLELHDKINSEEEAWCHFIYYGLKENRFTKYKKFLKKYCI
jgi:hypothetical protein